MKLEDKINVAVVGPIKSGRGVLVKKAVEYKELLINRALQGNFWVPKQLVAAKDKLNESLFERYSKDPKKYAFEFQMDCYANRLEQQSKVDKLSGIVLTGQPIEVDRNIYAEANREHIGEAFSTYEHIHAEVEKRIGSPDVFIYMQIPEEKVDVALKRIGFIGREGEKQFIENPSYLIENIRLNEKYWKNHASVIYVDGTHPAFDDENGNEDYFKELFSNIGEQIKVLNPPPRLTLDQWEVVDYNSAKKAMREARRQLRQYLHENQKLISFAGLVGVGKTGMADFVSDELEIGIMRELDGKNDEVDDEMLDKFLQNMEEECYNFQKHITPKRPEAEKEIYANGKSLATDRSKEEDVVIFQRRFHQKGYLTDEQVKELWELAREAYFKGPKSDCLIKLTISAEESRKRILQRDRWQEIKAWPPEELKAMHTLYSDFFEHVEKLGAHRGPMIDLDLAVWDPDKNIHQGHLFQEMLHGMLEFEK